MAVSEPDPALATVTVDALRVAAERGDGDAVANLLAPDVVFHSPMTSRVAFTGRAEVAALHRDIFAVLDDLRTTEPLALGNTRSFTFRATVRGVELDAVNLVTCDSQGKITEMTIFVRPLPALATLFATLPPRVSTRLRGPVLGTVAAVLTRPLAVVLRAADHLVPKFL